MRERESCYREAEEGAKGIRGAAVTTLLTLKSRVVGTLLFKPDGEEPVQSYFTTHVQTEGVCIAYNVPQKDGKTL